MDAMICPRCKMALPVSAAFCRRCGQRLSAAIPNNEPTPWWRSFLFGVDPLFWLCAVVGWMVVVLILMASLYERVAPSARLELLWNCIAGSAMGSLSLPIFCFIVAARLTRKSPVWSWIGGLVGIVLVIVFSFNVALDAEKTAKPFGLPPPPQWEPGQAVNMSPPMSPAPSLGAFEIAARMINGAAPSAQPPPSMPQIPLVIDNPDDIEALPPGTLLTYRGRLCQKAMVGQTPPADPRSIPPPPPGFIIDRP